MRHILALSLMFTVVLTLGCAKEKAADTTPETEAQAAEAEANPTATATKEADPATAGKSCLITMKVDGMACGVACPPQVSKALLSVAGVESVDVSYEKSQAQIKASGAACGEEHGPLVEALKSKSYEGKVTSVAEGPKDPS